MAIQEVTPVQANSKGGSGVLGTVLGGLAGAGLAAATIATGGAAAPLTVPAGLAAVGTGIGAGSAVGGLAGNMIDPAQSGGSDAPVPEIQSNRMGAMGKAPEVQMAGMQNAKNLLATSDVPNADYFMGIIDQAKERTKQRLGQNSFLA